MKQFAVTERDPDRKPVAPFKIGEREFQLYRPADSASLMIMNVASRFRPDQTNEAKMKAAAAVIDFLGACMEPSEYAELYEILVSPEGGMDDDELVELCKWAAETVNDRPTKRSTGSAAGRSTGGKKSTAAARSQA